MQNVTQQSVLILFCLGIICAYFAHRQKRNPYIWFGIGVISGIFGLLILVAILPLIARLKKAAIRKKAQTLQELSPTPSPSLAKSIPLSYVEKFWYYLDEENRQFGPMSFKALEDAWKTGQVKESTYVWNEEMPDWKKLGEISSFSFKIYT